MSRGQDTPRLLRLLTEAGVDFIVVGGVAAIAHGATTFTRDLDVLARFDEANLARLLDAIAPHHPRFALHPARPPLVQAAAELASFKDLCLDTDLGRLDVLGRLPNGAIAELKGEVVRMDLAGVVCAVLTLDALIASKERLGREKDRVQLLELRAIRERLAAAPDHDADG
ncbi:MAG: hypothetical protein KC635_27865 [Myxococcales bacterium]|nr:hypothetical protein [Myxococcales bacterium]MCB9736991.1 nucleotidyltransferase [Deltaproteobacteria bacterium]